MNTSYKSEYLSLFKTSIFPQTLIQKDCLKHRELLFSDFPIKPDLLLKNCMKVKVDAFNDFIELFKYKLMQFFDFTGFSGDSIGANGYSRSYSYWWNRHEKNKNDFHWICTCKFRIIQFDWETINNAHINSEPL